MKDYLKDSLSDEEERYIYGIINKTILKYFRKTNKLEKESISIDDDDFPEELLATEDKYNFVNKKLETKILRDICASKPYSKDEMKEIVDTLENIAVELGLSMFITPLTFNEKLVVFLLYLKKYQVNQIAFLLDVNRRTICNRVNSFKKKVSDVKVNLKNGR